MSYKDLDEKQGRARGQNSKNRHDNNKMKPVKYVVTNPDKDTRLEPEDLVFVLAK